MYYTDSVYGTSEIEEPLLLELINSPTLQRLKGIDQAGYFSPYFPGTSRSRFDHSLGVYLLLKKYWAPLEEQVAGLIHDVSHGTFSHCLDYIFEEWNQKKQDHQDNIFDEFIKKTDIPAILIKHWFSLENVLDDNRHPLKENNLPDICADRIDYSLRDALKYMVCSSTEITYILDHLIVKDYQRIFTDFASAKKYTDIFYRLNETYYAGVESAIMFQTVKDCLYYSWQQWYLDIDDFYTTDNQLLDKVITHIETDAQLSIYWERMNNKIPCKNDPDNYEFHVFCKSRLVDPLFIDGNEIKRVSDVDIEWKTIIQTAPKYKEYFLKFEK